MRIYYDTEFFQRSGRTINLISIGMVKDNGEEFYAVNSGMDTIAIAQDYWLMKNVMSSIDHEVGVSYLTTFGMPIRDFEITDSNAMSPKEIREGILDFIGPEVAELWAWNGAHDHRVLVTLFGDFSMQPGSVPFTTHDIATLAALTGETPPPQPAGLHNALDDARWNVVRYDYLMSKLNS